MSDRSSRSRRTVALVVAAVTGVLASSLLAAPASAADQASSATGVVRVAHLAPGTGAVDVALNPFGRRSTTMAARSVSYGELSAYKSVAAGRYTVTVRPASAAASAPPMLSATVNIRADSAHTVAALGTGKTLRAKDIVDDRTPAPAGQARIRLIQAVPDPAKLDIVAVDGPALADKAPYGTVTGYANVRQGRWTLKVGDSATGKTIGTPTVDLVAGSTYTVVALSTKGRAGGDVQLIAHRDLSGLSTAPSGGVETGAGGTAAAPSAGGTSGWLAGLSLIAIAACAVIGRRSRVRIPISGGR